MKMSFLDIIILLSVLPKNKAKANHHFFHILDLNTNPVCIVQDHSTLGSPRDNEDSKEVVNFLPYKCYEFIHSKGG